IFDLDNCLASAAEVGEHLLLDTFEAISRANEGTLTERELELAFADCWYHSLDWVAARHGFSARMLDAAWDVLRTKEVTQAMRGYGDLHVLAEFTEQIFLVTTGF